TGTEKQHDYLLFNKAGHYLSHGGSGMRQRVRLTAEDIPLIRALLDSGMPVAEVARKFETSKQHIYSIRNGKNWGAVK
ncbi:helix-turn-helix domain-containing protein, partial [Candidatus Symbiopectobacterium sp.]|uniref:helix-turn-helix domain-containing protein n=1 Tax=Candidatus Symbiopectobacterium sp. TaxID=2816440 RepID=UPI0025C5E5FD